MNFHMFFVSIIISKFTGSKFINIKYLQISYLFLKLF